MTIEPLRTQLMQAHPQDAARVLEQFPAESVAHHLESSPAGSIATVFDHLSPSMTSACLAAMTDRQVAEVLKLLGVERAALYLRRMTPSRRNQLLAILPRVFAGLLKMVLRYPDGTVGQFMDPNPVTVNHRTRVEHVLDMLRDNSKQLENEIYVVDENLRLAGIVNVRHLIAASADEPVSRLMQRARYSIPARSRLGQVRSLVGKRYRDFYPVIDQNRLFIGVLRYEILLEAFNEVDPASTEYADLTTGMLVMADLFWNSFLNLLVPGESTRRGRDD